MGLIPPILLATLLGALVGLEREIHGHPAGLRTHILVALGSTLVTLVSVSMADYGSRGGDPGRIASQIVTGIGFLGAGAIIREGASIRGLTTAASIWAMAMVGIAVGVSPRMAFLGSVTTVLCLLVLSWLHRVEEAMERRGIRDRVLDVHISETPQATSEVFGALMELGTSVEGVTMETVRGSSGRRLFVRVRLKAGQDPSALIARLTDLPGVRSVAWQ